MFIYKWICLEFFLTFKELTGFYTVELSEKCNIIVPVTLDQKKSHGQAQWGRVIAAKLDPDGGRKQPTPSIVL